MSWFKGERSPRDYAQWIMGQPDKEKRRKMFEEVPQHLRDMVYDHCKTAQQLGGKGK